MNTLFSTKMYVPLLLHIALDTQNTIETENNMSLPINEENRALQYNPTEGTLTSVEVLNPENILPTTLDALHINEATLQEILVQNFPTHKWNDPYNALDWVQQRPFYGNECVLLRKEFHPFSAHIANGRIDICALDEQGRTIIIELKTKDVNSQLGQALCYAGLLSEIENEEFLHLFSQEKQTEINAFLQKHNIDIASLNHGQRIVLIAEDFSAELLAAAELLNGMHNTTKDESLFVECLQVTPYVDQNNTIYLHFQPRKDPTISGSVAEHRQDILDCIEYTTNEAAKTFLQKYTDGEWNTADKVLYFRKPFRFTEPRSWKVRVRQKHLNILQTFYCRFDDDILFWKEFLSEPRFVVENKKGISFRLVTPEDIALFESCVRREFKFLSKAREFSTSLKEN